MNSYLNYIVLAAFGLVGIVSLFMAVKNLSSKKILPFQEEAAGILFFFTPVLPLIFCTGLFFSNYILYKKTKANTPWIKSLVAILILILGLYISILL